MLKLQILDMVGGIRRDKLLACKRSSELTEH
jgi:hypothetical protein